MTAGSHPLQRLKTPGPATTKNTIIKTQRGVRRGIVVFVSDSRIRDLGFEPQCCYTFLSQGFRVCVWDTTDKVHR